MPIITPKAIASFVVIAACVMTSVAPVSVSVAQAADINTIKSKVEQRVEERQQQVEQGQTEGFTNSNNQPNSGKGGDTTHTEDTPEVRTTHWSIFGGIITLHSINEQLYLSVF
jgi:hypothetical protein